MASAPHPTITAVIPSYNSARYIAQTVESVLRQTIPVDEVIVVDDGSTDETGQALAPFLDRIRYIRQANGGVSNARNHGIREAKGEWIGLLDADDLWVETKIEKQLRALAACPDAILVYTALQLFDDAGFDRHAPVTPPDRLFPEMYTRCNLTPSTALVRRDKLLEAGLFDEDRNIMGCEDWDMFAKLARLGRFTHVQEPLVRYRYVGGSLSSKNRHMVRAAGIVMDRTLLRGLRPWERWYWKRKGMALQHYHASVSLRAESRAAERSQLLLSVGNWPSPGYLPPRFKALALNLLGRGHWRAGA